MLEGAIDVYLLATRQSGTMQHFKHVARVRLRAKMSSPSINNGQLSGAGQSQLKLHGGGDMAPPKISAARLQNDTEDIDSRLDVHQILNEARAAGATQGEIDQFFRTSRETQLEELLKSENTVEPQGPEEDDETYSARFQRVLTKSDTQVYAYVEQRAHSREQSERDKTPKGTPTGTPTKTHPTTPTGTPEPLTPGSTPPSKRQEKRQRKKEEKEAAKVAGTPSPRLPTEEYRAKERAASHARKSSQLSQELLFGDIERTQKAKGESLIIPTAIRTISTELPLVPAPSTIHGALVVGRTKRAAATIMDSSNENGATAQLNAEIEKNVENNTAAAAPAESTNKPKKDKAPKQPKAQKAAPPTAPLTPAVIDLRVGHILRAVEHPNADTMYVSTIAMGDPEGAEHTEIDEQTGKVVRTVCSGLKAYVKLEDMQDRLIVVVANLKPANLRSIKSAAMVLAASPKPEEGADPHSADRTVELVQPPEGSVAGDKVYFEGWPYGEGKGPEKQLNPKKKTWEMLQPGFYTTEDLVVAFDASKSEMDDKSGKGELVVNGKGKCTVASLRGAVVR